MIYHPDRNLGDSAEAARQKFMAASEAYEMLAGNHAKNRFAASPGWEAAPNAPPPPPPRTPPRTRHVRITVEWGWLPGSTVSIVFEGQTVMFVIPAGAVPGQNLIVEMPLPPGSPPPTESAVSWQRATGLFRRVAGVLRVRRKRDGSRWQRVAGLLRRVAGSLRGERGLEVEPLWSYTLASGGRRLMVKVRVHA